jgi:hypothetical protein
VESVQGCCYQRQPPPVFQPFHGGKITALS